MVPNYCLTKIVSVALAVEVWRIYISGSTFGACCLVSAAETMPLAKSLILT